jgi:hypothetical protein
MRERQTEHHAAPSIDESGEDSLIARSERPEEGIIVAIDGSRSR